MAEGTRLKELSEQIRTIEEKMLSLTTECHSLVDERLQQFGMEYNQKLGTLVHQLDEIQRGSQQRDEAQQLEATKRHEQLMKLFSSQANIHKVDPTPSIHIREGRFGGAEVLGSSTKIHFRDDKGKGVLPNPHVNADSYTPQPIPRQPHFIPYPKLDFPIFGGDEPREWFSRSEQFLRLYQIPEEQWVEIATMHFTGKAHKWKEGYMLDKPELGWEELVEAICRRFDGDSMKKLVREFNKLEQTTSVEAYQERFEEMRARMLYLNPTLNEDHFIQSYISGLKKELIPFIDLSNPTTLEEVYEQAKLHEHAISIMWKKHKLANRTGSGHPQGYQNFKPFNQRGYPRYTENNKANPPKSSTWQSGVSRQVIEQRRAAGLCFKCGEKYYQGHQCQGKSLNQIGGEYEVEEVFDEGLLQEEEEEAVQQDEPDEMGISVHALSGETPQETLKVQGEVGGKPLVILIDTGSTHSFIDYQVAKELKANMTVASPLIVTVADGHKVLSKLKCTRFQWMMHGESYQADLRVIRLDGSGIILGIDWLKKHGRVTFDYSNNSVSFNKDGKAVTVEGITESAKLKSIGAKQWLKAGMQGHCCAIAQLKVSTEQGEEHMPVEVQKVLELHAHIFQDPKGLPPKRNQDHRIPLQPGVKPINVRPYRHSYEQKNEVEKQVAELLKSNFIRTSNSPYASPVLLVKKKDQS